MSQWFFNRKLNSILIYFKCTCISTISLYISIIRPLRNTIVYSMFATTVIYFNSQNCEVVISWKIWVLFYVRLPSVTINIVFYCCTVWCYCGLFCVHLFTTKTKICPRLRLITGLEFLVVLGVMFVYWDHLDYVLLL